MNKRMATKKKKKKKETETEKRSKERALIKLMAMVVYIMRNRGGRRGKWRKRGL